MYKIIIPAGNTCLSKMIPYCNHYSCTVRHWKRDNNYFEILSSDPENFYWLGANLNNELLNELYAKIGER